MKRKDPDITRPHSVFTDFEGFPVNHHYASPNLINHEISADVSLTPHFKED